MIYSPLVQKACQIMFEAHKEDVDKGGYPYVFHPFFLATQMEDEVSVCVALLHDVVEDHADKYSFEALKEAGFGEDILTPLRLLTHEKGVPYEAYVREIAANPTAARVKLADLRHNTDTSRTDGSKPKKYAMYQNAIAFLENSLK